MKRMLRSSLSQLFYLGGKCLGQNGKQGVRILCYHRVNDREEGYMSVPVKSFEQQMVFLAEKGYRTISLKALLDGNAEPKSIVITFDDGYEDNYTNAFPVLREFGFTATIFCITQKLDTPGYLTRAQIRQMTAAGFSFGSHTLSHPDLRSLSRREKLREISSSRVWLEEALGLACDFFCYPYGLHDEESVQLVREAGYRGACSNAPGANRAGNLDPYRLRRTEVGPADTADDFKKKLEGAYDFLHQSLHWMRGRP